MPLGSARGWRRFWDKDMPKQTDKAVRVNTDKCDMLWVMGEDALILMPEMTKPRL